MRTLGLFCICYMLHYSLNVEQQFDTDGQVFDFAHSDTCQRKALSLCVSVVKSVSMMVICKLCQQQWPDEMSNFEDHLQCPCRKCPIVILLSHQSQLPLHYNYLLLISILIGYLKYSIFYESVAPKFAFIYDCINS